jgi:hypothetical protein
MWLALFYAELGLGIRGFVVQTLTYLMGAEGKPPSSQHTALHRLAFDISSMTACLSGAENKHVCSSASWLLQFFLSVLLRPDSAPLQQLFLGLMTSHYVSQMCLIKEAQPAQQPVQG